MGILRSSGSYVSEALVSELRAQIEANESRKQELAEMEKRKAEERLSKKAQEIFDQMSDDEKRAKMPESPVAKFGSVAFERLLLAQIKVDLAD
ncbi:MAG: hypothetical protein KDD43_00135 [Bdellovibrionales bacterium]|nr:hypothetical protein [Bdellovibrionales bacterium]